MLPAERLKEWVHRDFSKPDKLLLILATFDSACQVRDVKKRAKDAGLRSVDGWNVSTILARTNGLAINSSAGWELSPAGKERVRSLGVSSASLAAAQVATDLRALLAKIKEKETHEFLDEAIRCHELECWRAAVVISWLAAMHVLKVEVHKNHLTAFNTEATRVDSRWRAARTTDDLGQMKEADFLDRIAAISMIGKNVKEELQKCLKTRNACGHPNSFRIARNGVAHQLEILLLNVFQRFC